MMTSGADRIVLDTSAYIHLRSGNTHVAHVVAEASTSLAALRAAGTPIPTNDVWIAAITVETGGRLVTFDGDFERVEGLLLTRLVA